MKTFNSRDILHRIVPEDSENSLTFLQSSVFSPRDNTFSRTVPRTVPECKVLKLIQC